MTLNLILSYKRICLYRFSHLIGTFSPKSILWWHDSLIYLPNVEFVINWSLWNVLSDNASYIEIPLVGYTCYITRHFFLIEYNQYNQLLVNKCVKGYVLDENTKIIRATSGAGSAYPSSLVFVGCA